MKGEKKNRRDWFGYACMRERERKGGDGRREIQSECERMTEGERDCKYILGSVSMM